MFLIHQDSLELWDGDDRMSVIALDADHGRKLRPRQIELCR
jgi:hypothetical protein